MKGISATLLAILAGSTIAASWLLPSTLTSCLLGWLSAIFLVSFARHPHAKYRDALLIGCIINLVCFYWLFWSIKDFGGFDYFAATLVFLFFVVASSNQQLVFLFLYRHLPRWVRRTSIPVAVAWMSSEYVSIRIFPWSFGHTQSAFELFSQSADIVGTSLIGFTMLWLADGLREYAQNRTMRRLLIPLAAFAVLLAYGGIRVLNFRQDPQRGFSVSLIQANVSIAEKHDVHYFLKNRERYEELSAKSPENTDLLVWPESVVTDFISDFARSVTDDPHLPFVREQTAMLIGGLTFRSRAEYFNSALLITANGSVLPPYHKRILMPFGEFTPFSKYLPWLKDINATAGEFTAGVETAVYNVTLPRSDVKSVSVSPLICYEDIVPSMARSAVNAGAEVLINLTNDAWFGDTVAPLQHHLIASFRAIENRRYLLRSTNSGLTAVVNPLGETVSSLPTFSDGILNLKISPRSELSLYTAYFGDFLWWGIAILSALVGVVRAASGVPYRKQEHGTQTRA